MPEIIIVVAVARNGVIGDRGKLPWHLPSDLRHFKETTMGHPLVMGRKTFEAIGKPLPGRENIVLSRDAARSFPGCKTCRSLADALDYCKDKEKIFVIGGGELFRAALPVTDTIIVTALERDVAGDVTFPSIDPRQFAIVDQRRLVREEPYSIIHYQRIRT